MPQYCYWMTTMVRRAEETSNLRTSNALCCREASSIWSFRSQTTMTGTLGDYSDAIWDVDSASVTHSSSDLRVISMRKRSCVANARRCPWMDKRRKTGRPFSETIEEEDGGFRIREDDTYLRYERRVAGAVTIAPGVAERTRETTTGRRRAPRS
mmetsp:Transcript_36392/g.77582  ORF Transcript_36392/g.77582 Transcript_36392/m.77582 type:complete len:154 (-) Transcript_36392:437-898(-)